MHERAKRAAMKIDVSYDELLTIANALKARGYQLDEFSKKWSPDMGHDPQYWAAEGAKHQALADRLVADAAEERR
jgi:hypothetical protein